MGPELVINMQWWHLMLGLILGFLALVSGFERLAKRLLTPWLQEHVGKMMDQGMARERVHSDAIVAALELKFTACQTQHMERARHDAQIVARIEQAIQGEIKEIKSKLDDMVEQLTGVREHLSLLAGQLPQREKAAQ